MDRDLDAVSRAVRADFLDAREMDEEATEHLARKEADLVDVVLDAMQRGQPVRLRVGSWQFSGAIVHVADDVVVIDDAGGAQIDVRLGAVAELWLSEPVPGAGRGRRSDVPGSFVDCLEGLEATGRDVELGGPDLAPTRCRVGVVAGDHLVLEARRGEHIVARAAVGFVIRRP